MQSLISMHGLQWQQLNVQRTPGFPRPAEASRPCVAISAQRDEYKVIVVGGGCAGSAVAAHYGRKFGQQQVAVIESSGASFSLSTLVHLHCVI